MKRKTAAVLGSLTLALAAGAAMVSAQSAKTTLTVFMGSQQRPEIFGPLFQRFEQANPNITVKLETGGATSEIQNQYLTTVMAAKDPTLDVFLMDIIRTAPYAAAGWLEPMDKYFGSDAAKKAFLSGFIPGAVQGNTVEGKLYGMPSFTDIQLLYYRKDLLDKYNARVPRTWEELATTAQRIMKAENNPNLQGFNYQGKAIEGALCTFLEPFWSAGGNVVTNGKVTIDSVAGHRAFDFLTDAINKYKITPASIGEVATDDSRKQFQAGNVLFGLQWSYGWAHFQGNSPQETKVKGLVGVAKLPVFDRNQSATCVGGWNWGISAYSKQKEAAFALVKFMSSPAIQQEMAVKGAYLPVRKSLYYNPKVLEANPHFKTFYPVVLNARPRPVSANFARISEVMRNNVNAVVSGSKSADAALKEMQAELEKAGLR